jgi:hypothetical protein
MKIIFLILTLIVSPYVYSKRVCVTLNKTSVKEEAANSSIDISVTDNEKEQSKTFCYDVDGSGKILGLAGGGGCGSSSQCGNNFLIIDDEVYNFGEVILLGENQIPDYVMSLNSWDETIHIAEDLETAKHILKNKQHSDSLIMSAKLSAGINAGSDYKLKNKMENLQSLFDKNNTTEKMLNGITLNKKDFSNIKLIQVKQLDKMPILSPTNQQR